MTGDGAGLPGSPSPGSPLFAKLMTALVAWISALESRMCSFCTQQTLPLLSRPLACWNGLCTFHLRVWVFQQSREMQEVYMSRQDEAKGG